MKLYISVLFICCFGSLFLEGQNEYGKAIQALVNDPLLQHAGVGIHLVEVVSGDVLATHNADQNLTPASALKLISSATAWSVVSPSFQYETQLQISGALNNGILDGNIIIKGVGDPTLGSASWKTALSFEKVMEKFKLAIQQFGIRKVNGYIIGDDSYYSTEVTPKTWQLNDLGNYYAAGVHGLNIHDNLYYLRFQQSSTLGRTPSISSVKPAVAGLEFINEIVSDKAGTGDNAYIYGAPFTNLKFIRGTIPVGNRLFTIKGAIPDPALFMAQQLEHRLRVAGITSELGSTTSRVLNLRKETMTGRKTTLISQSSPALHQIVGQTLFKSVNLYAESFLHLLGKLKGEKGNTEEGIKVLKAYWKSKGLKTNSIRIADGSGLSSKNAVNAKFMTDVLRQMASREDFDRFLGAIPLAGRTGSLRNRFKGTSAEGKLYAKSGTLDGVRSYAGYIKISGNRLLCFCVFVNDYEGKGSAIRRKLDQLLIQFSK